MSTQSMSYNEMKSKCEQLGLIGTLPDMKKATLIAALEAYQEPGENVVEEKLLGRPININSARQIRLREMEARKAAGAKQGRPVNPNSARQQHLASKGTNVDENGVAHKGRPVNANSKRQLELAARQEKIAAGYVPKKGRPANPNKVAAKQAKSAMEKRFQVVITTDEGTHTYSKSFKLAKSAINEMKNNGYNSTQYKLVEFTAAVDPNAVNVGE